MTPGSSLILALIASCTRRGIGAAIRLDLGVATISRLVWVWVERWSLFDSIPATSRVNQQAALDDLGDAVLVIDDRPPGKPNPPTLKETSLHPTVSAADKPSRACRSHPERRT